MRVEASECVSLQFYGETKAQRGYVARPCLPLVLVDVGQRSHSSAALASCCHMVSQLKLSPAQPLLTNSLSLLTLGL